MSETVAQRIKLLEAKGLTLEQFVDATPEITAELARFFGVSQDYLLHGEPGLEPDPEPAVDFEALWSSQIRANAVLVERLQSCPAEYGSSTYWWKANQTSSKLVMERTNERDTLQARVNELSESLANTDHSRNVWRQSSEVQLAAAKRLCEKVQSLTRELEETTGTMDHYRKRAIKAEHNENALRKQYEGGGTARPHTHHGFGGGPDKDTDDPQPTYAVDENTPDFPALCPDCGSLSVRRVIATLMCGDCPWVIPIGPTSEEYKAKMFAFRAANAERERQITEARFGAEGDK